MTVYVVGNPLVKKDSVPIKLLPRLKRTFPGTFFITVDPNENFVPEAGSAIIDTIEGIDKVQVFKGTDAFVTTASVSLHDFDLGFHLKLLEKLHKLQKVAIIGIPSGMSADQAWQAVYRLMDNGKRKG